MKLEVQFDPESRFDQRIRCLTQTAGAAVVRQPGFVARCGNRRTAEADQARIDLRNFFEEL